MGVNPHEGSSPRFQIFFGRTSGNTGHDKTDCNARAAGSTSEGSEDVTSIDGLDLVASGEDDRGLNTGEDAHQRSEESRF